MPELIELLNDIIMDDRNIGIVNKVLNGPVKDAAELTFKQAIDIAMALVMGGHDIGGLAKLLGVQLIEHSTDPAIFASKLIELRKSGGK